MAFFSNSAGRRLFTVRYLLLFKCSNCWQNKKKLYTIAWHMATIKVITQAVDRNKEAGTRMEICHGLAQLERMEQLTENMNLRNCLVSLFLLFKYLKCLILKWFSWPLLVRPFSQQFPHLSKIVYYQLDWNHISFAYFGARSQLNKIPKLILQRDMWC